METKSTKVSKNEIYSTIDLSTELKGVSKSDQDQLKEEIGELLLEQILESLADVQSPVQGGKYKATLTPAYKKKKEDETGGSSDANLDLTGNLISSIDYRVKGNTIQVGVFDSENAGKADGHNNFSGNANPKYTRQFLPKEGQQFRSDIMKLMAETVENYKAESTELDTERLNEIESKSELFDYLKEELGIDSTAAMKRAVLGSKNLIELLDDYDLLDYIDG